MSSGNALEAVEIEGARERNQTNFRDMHRVIFHTAVNATPSLRPSIPLCWDKSPPPSFLPSAAGQFPLALPLKSHG